MWESLLNFYFFLFIHNLPHCVSLFCVYFGKREGEIYASFDYSGVGNTNMTFGIGWVMCSWCFCL